MSGLTGKVAVVTGGASGIGLAVARTFSEAGAAVAIFDANFDKAHEVAESLPDAIAVHTDVSNSQSVDAAFDAAVARFGTVDVLANIAGISGRNDSDQAERMKQQALEARTTGKITTGLDCTVRLTDSQWERMLAVHLNGTFYCCRAALRIMAPRRSGTIINTASNTAITGWAGVPHYCAAKGGILSFSRSLAKEVIVQGIRVNVIAPGGIDTPMSADIPDEQRAAFTVQIPAGRFGQVNEAAAAYLFLASDSSSYIIGETLNVNGGILTI